MNTTTKFADLQARVISAICMLVIGAMALWLGGWVFTLLIVAAVAAMHWEMGRMLTPLSMQVIVIFIATLLQRLYFHTFDTFGTLVSLGVMIGALLLIYLRTQVGITATLWIIGLVVITDIAGYFVGRIVGGVKFWPAFSPKKTWSGIVGGWFGAALFTYFMVQGGHISLPTETALFVALCLSFASQLGDITESALKRASGVKDSSNLIPGHGGFMDRFDGLIGASLVYAAMLGLMAWA